MICKVRWVVAAFLLPAVGVLASELGPAQVYRLVAPSVVLVEAVNSKGTAQGSGVVVGDRQVITNSHVVRGAAGFVLIRQGESVWRAEIENVDEQHDLAVLGILLRRSEKFGLPSLKMRRATTVRIGDTVFAVGAPRGLEQSLSGGLVSGLPLLADGRIIQTTASISPGSSGGGLFDARGALIGITTVYLRDSQNVNFAVISDHVEALLAQGAPWLKDPYALGASIPASQAAALVPDQPPSHDLPVALSSISGVVVSAKSSGPIATAGRMTDEWLRSRVTARLRNRGVWVFSTLDEAASAGKVTRPLVVNINSMNIKNTVLYPWQIELNVLDTSDFSDGSNDILSVWSFATYGYGGSDVVLKQVTETIDQTIDHLAEKLARE